MTGDPHRRPTLGCIQWLLLVLGVVAIVTIVFVRLRSGSPLGSNDLLLACAAVGVGAFAAIMFRWKRRPQTVRHVPSVCQRCGYDLEHSPLARCPECGALTGFTKSAEELGIRPEELRWSDSSAKSSVRPDLNRGSAED